MGRGYYAGFREIKSLAEILQNDALFLEYDEKAK